jgi:iron complex outermembrane receptor protein
MHFQYGAATLLLLSFSVAAVAQTKPAVADLDLEDLMKVTVQSVFGASKFLQKVTDAPAAVSVVTALDIERYGYRTLADVIRSAPGFNVTYDRNYTYVGVRGFQRPGDYNSRVLVLVDGHRINDPIYDMAYVGTEFPIDIELVDRVELIRGPSSSIYGTNAFFAVINVVTKKGDALKGLLLGGDGGSLQTGRARGAFGATLRNGLDLLVSGSRYRSGGAARLFFPEFDDPTTHSGVAQDLDGDANYHLFGSVSFKGLSFQGAYGTRAKHVPTAPFGSWFNDPRMKTNDGQGWADLRYVRDLPAEWKFTGRAYYDRQAYNGRYPSNVSETNEPSITVFGDYARSAGWGTEVGVEKIVAKRHKVTAGAEYRDKFRLDQGGFDEATGVLYLDDRRSSRDSAVFAEDQITIHDKLLLNVGLRSDRYQAFGSTTNPRLAVIFKPAPETAIKGLWGTAFRAPNAYERYYSSDLIQPNPNLEPETIRTGELVVERYFSEHYRVMADVYTSHVRGLISHVVSPDGQLRFLNLSAALRGPGRDAQRQLHRRLRCAEPDAHHPRSSQWLEHVGERLQPVERPVRLSRRGRAPAEHHLSGRSNVPRRPSVCVASP